MDSNWQTAHLAMRQHSLPGVAGQLVHHLVLQTYLQTHNRIGNRHTTDGCLAAAIQAQVNTRPMQGCSAVQAAVQGTYL